MLCRMRAFLDTSTPAGPLLLLLFAAPLLAAAWVMPGVLPMVVLVPLLLGAVLLAARHPIPVSAAWLLVTGLSLEMTLSDLIGPEAYQVTIAAAKGGEIGLAALLLLRHGGRLDPFNPAWAFLAIAVIGMAVGIHPALSQGDMLRSLIGSATPYLLAFCRVPADWGRTIRRTVVFIPIVSVVLGGILAAIGLRPLFVESGGMRLAALGHPAFLAGVCLPAIYAGLLGWLRTGSGRQARLLIVNLVILVLTGARAPLAYAALVLTVSLLFAPGGAIPQVRRLMLVGAGLIALPAILLLGESLGSLRLFTVIAGDEAANLSGRDLLWPAFEAAANQAPWFGWGLGAGNVVLPHDGPIAQLLHTWAAHNEYLRMRVEGGYVGRTILIVCFALWAVLRSRGLPPLERLVIRTIFVAFACHAYTDNVLISTPACVFFAFVTAVFAERAGDRRA